MIPLPRSTGRTLSLSIALAAALLTARAVASVPSALPFAPHPTWQAPQAAAGDPAAPAPDTTETPVLAYAGPGWG